MRPHKLTLQLSVILFLLVIHVNVLGQQRKEPTGGRLAVVVDEHLAALRWTPRLYGKVVRRLGRGRLVAIRFVRIGPDGATYLFVDVTTCTRVTIPRESG